MRKLPVLDGILYESPGPWAPTEEIERALREMRQLPLTQGRQDEIKVLEQEVARRRGLEAAE
jgi:hypothetical protein